MKCSGCKFSPLRDAASKETTSMACESKKEKCERGYWQHVTVRRA